MITLRSADTGNEQLGLTDVTQMICNAGMLGRETEKGLFWLRKPNVMVSKHVLLRDCLK